MKHKRLILFLLLLMAGLSPLMAQRLGGGLMLGPAFSTMNISEIDSTRFRTDFTGGVRVALIPKRSFIGAELDLLYSRQGMKTPKGLAEDGSTIRYSMRSHYVTMPLLLNVYFRRWNEDDDDESKLVRLRFGPQIGFCLGGNNITDVKLKKTQKQYIVPWEQDSFNHLDYGITAAISYWFVEVRYTYGMANVFKEGEKSINHVISVTWSDIW